MTNTMRPPRGSIFGVAGLLLVTASSARATQASTGPSTTQIQTDQGQQNFQTLCSVCHTVGGGRLVGPDLQGVSERRSEGWIIRFVQHSQELVKAGDPDAVALFQEFNGIPMPDQPLSDEEIRGIVRDLTGGASAPFWGVHRFRLCSGPTRIGCSRMPKSWRWSVSSSGPTSSRRSIAQGTTAEICSPPELQGRRSSWACGRWSGAGV